MKKKRFIWIVTVIAIFLIFIFVLLTGRLDEERKSEDEGYAHSGADHRLNGRQNQGNDGGHVRGDEDSQKYSLKIVEMNQAEKDETLKKLFSYMENCKEIYSRAADHGNMDSSEASLDENTLHEMIEKGGAESLSVTCGNRDYNLTNYEKVEAALKKAQEGKAVETEFYQVNSVGIFRYYRLEFEKKELYVTSASAVFDEEMNIGIQQLEKIKAYQWEYTDKGWLIWEKALSRNQEMDMHIFCRIYPLDEKCREITNQYIEPVSYFSNNLFLEDWDMACMEKIEFNDLFDFLYPMAAGKPLEGERYADGIPKEEFESVIGQFFDIRKEQIEQFARFDSGTGRYPWTAVGFWNRVQQLQPSFPEVVRCLENEDGTITAYVEAVSIEEGTDCYYAHAVTLRRKEDGTYAYVGNRVDRERSYCIPAYKARREFERTDTAH